MSEAILPRPQGLNSRGVDVSLLLARRASLLKCNDDTQQSAARYLTSPVRGMARLTVVAPAFTYSKAFPACHVLHWNDELPRFVE
jgi:hypothetical protein